MFGEVPAPALVALAARVRARTIAAGATASTRRDGSDHVVVVAAGALRGPAGPLPAGAVAGVDAALIGAAPEALVAVTDAAVVEIPVDDFLDLLAEHAPATAALARALAARLRGDA